MNKNNPIDENPKTILGKHKLKRKLSSISFQVTQGCNSERRYCLLVQRNRRYHNNRKLNFDQSKKSLAMVCSCSMNSSFIFLYIF